jgi:hypothetical protein
MAFDQTQNESGHAEALPGGEVGQCTQREYQGRVGTVAASLQRFTGNPSPLASGAPWWDTSGALAQPCAAADAVERPRLSKPSWPARLILMRWASKSIKAKTEKALWESSLINADRTAHRLRRKAGGARRCSGPSVQRVACFPGKGDRFI